MLQRLLECVRPKRCGRRHGGDRERRRGRYSLIADCLCTCRSQRGHQVRAPLLPDLLPDHPGER